MKKLFVVALAAMAMVSCVNDELVGVKEGDAIVFDNAFIDNATRSADPSTTLNGENALTAFDVWAVVNQVSGKVFEDENVTLVDGKWGYTNTQYWAPAKTYYFAALAPMDSANWSLDTANGTINGPGVVTFTNVDGSEDLIYAVDKVVTDDPIVEQPEAVKFHFSHMLSKVKFTFTNGFQNANNTLKVYDIQMEVPGQGTLALQNGKENAAWTLVEGSKQTLAFGEVDVLKVTESKDCTDERLTIPADGNYIYNISFKADLFAGDVLLQTFTETTQITGIAFEKGKAYNLTAKLDAENLGLFPVKFDVIEVKDWENGGDFNADLHNAVVGTDAEFAAALAKNALDICITLTDNVAVDVNAHEINAFGGDITRSITINGNGHTVTFNQLNSDWNHIITKNGAKLVINNAKLTNSGKNNGPWNRHDLNFACPVELNKVQSDKAIALKADGKLTEVTIADANTSDTYALWIQPNGQTVTLDGCTIDMLAATDGRGIKIDNQYVESTEKKVTLNVKNTTFKTEEKSAILVKSKVGAAINVENINIAEVKADSDFAVWVDDATAAYADLVVVNGALCKVEGVKAAVADTYAELKSGLAVANNTVILMPTADGEDLKMEGKMSLAEGVSLIGYGDEPVGVFNDWGSNAFAYQAHFTNTHIENISFTNNLVIDAGIANGNVTFKGCVFGGNLAHQGVHFDSGNATIVFEDCTFVGRNMFGSSLTKVIFNNCTFLNKKSSLTGADKWTGVNMWGKYEFNNCKFDTEAQCCVKCAGVEADFNNCVFTNGNDIKSLILNGNNYAATIKFDGVAL